MNSYKEKYTKCPLCNSADFKLGIEASCTQHPLYDTRLPPTLQWCVCNSCGHEFTESFFTPKGLELVFSNTNESQSVGYQIEHQRGISANIVEKVLPFVNEGAWLDVGFGNASLLFTAQEFGFSPVGVDLREKSVDSLKKLGIEAHCENIETLSLDYKPSVISLMDVLEHVPFPKTMLRAVTNLLCTDGVLLLSMPNKDPLLWKVMSDQAVNPYLGELEHYHNFGRLRLYDLLREFELEPVSYGVSQRYRCGMEILAVKSGSSRNVRKLPV